MAQFARPGSTVETGGWSAVGAATCHEATDEVTPNGDTDYALAESGDTTLKMGLSSVADPQVGTGHTLRVNAMASGSKGPEKLDIYLYQGTTLICTALAAGGITRDSYNPYNYTLTALEADAITDYSALRVWINVNSLGAGEYIRVTQTEFEVPDAAGGLYYQTLPATEVSSTVLSKGAAFYRAFAASALGGAVISKAGSFYRTIAGTVVGAPSFVKKITHDVAVTIIGVASMTRAKVFLKTLAATCAVSVSLGKAILKSLAATVTGAAGLIRWASLKRTIAATLAGGAVLTRLAAFKRTLAATTPGVAVVAFVAKFKRALAAIAVGITTLDAQKLAGAIYYQTVVATLATVAGISRYLSLGRALIATTTGGTALALTSLFKRALSVIESSVLTLDAHKLAGALYYKTIAATVGIVAGISRGLSLARTLAGAAVGSVVVTGKGFYYRALSAIAAGATSVKTTIGVIKVFLTATAAVSPVLIRAAKLYRALSTTAHGIINMVKTWFGIEENIIVYMEAGHDCIIRTQLVDPTIIDVKTARNIIIKTEVY